MLPESENEVKTPAELAQEQRDKISVMSSSDEKKEDDKIEDNKNDENNDDKNSEGTEEKKEENEEIIEESEKTEEELETEKIEAKTLAERTKIQKRIDREVAKRKVAEAEVVRLNEQLSAKTEGGEKVLTEEDIEKEAERRAAIKDAEREFIKACNRLQENAIKISKDFDKKIAELSDDIGPIPSQLIGILDDIENGGAILNYLTDNPDEAEEIYQLPTAKMAVKLAKIGIKLTPIKESKKVSQVPPPNEIIKTNGRTTNQLNDNMDVKTWIETRNAQQRSRGKV